MQLAFDQPSVTNTSISYLDQPGKPLYTVETRLNSTMRLHKTTRVYRLEPDKQLIGHIELHVFHSDVVRNGERDVQPYNAEYSLKSGPSKDFKSHDGKTYSWTWETGVGWSLQSAREGREVAKLTPDESNLLPVFDFFCPVSTQLQDEIVLTAIYLEQQRRRKTRTNVSYDEFMNVEIAYDAFGIGEGNGGDGDGGGGDGGGGGD